MGTVSITQLKSGMILSADLIAPNGRFILPRGACLTSRNIMSLKIWGVAEVSVSDRSDPPREDGDEFLYSTSVMEEANDIVLRIFGGVPPECGAMEEIHRVAIREAARSLTENEAGHSGFFRSENAPLSEASLPKPSLEQLAAAEVRFVSFPDVYFRISEALQSPKSSITHVADLISKDTALTATLLKLANSAIYGVPAKVDSIQRAAALIGGKALSILALGVSAVQTFNSIPSDWVNMESFWRHSVAVAVLGQIISSRKHSRIIERMFVGGILHDIGRLVLLRHVPSVMNRAIAAAAAEKIPLVDMERRILGFDHGELGGTILERWGFPRELTDLVRFHHSPGEETNSFPAAALSMADTLAAALRQGSSGSPHPPSISDEVWKMTDLSPGALDSVVRQARRQIAEIYRLFKGGDDDGKTGAHS